MYDLEEGIVGPITEPVEDASIEERGRRRGAILESVGVGVHGEDDVKVLHDLAREPFVELFVRVQHETLSLGTLFALRHQGCVLVSLEQSGNLAIGQKRVHAFQEARVQDVGLVEDERDFFVFAARSAEDLAQVLVKVFASVFVVNLEAKRMIYLRW